jgi:single-stranded DNA-specific DHH superfamily exonuclease
MGAREEAKAFLEEIKPSDKIALVFHDDLDGFASGVLLYDYCIGKGADVKIYIFAFGKTNLEELKEKFQDFNKVIFSDVAPFGIAKEMAGIEENKECLSIDHHKAEFELPENVIDYRSQGYIPASRMTYELINGKDWLALAGTISDAGHLYPENKDFIDKSLDKLHFNLKDFQKKVSEKLERFLIYFDEDLYKAFDELKELNEISELNKIEKYAIPVEEEFNRLYKGFNGKKEKLGEVWFYYVEPKFGVGTILINKISMENPNDIFVCVRPSDNGKLSISCRNNKKRVSMISLIKACTSGLPESSGGGHDAAAGGSIRPENLAQFKENLGNYKI